jgi:hypothetical protein
VLVFERKFFLHFPPGSRRRTELGRKLVTIPHFLWLQTTRAVSCKSCDGSGPVNRVFHVKLRSQLIPSFVFVIGIFEPQLKMKLRRYSNCGFRYVVAFTPTSYKLYISLLTLSSLSLLKRNEDVAILCFSFICPLLQFQSCLACRSF